MFRDVAESGKEGVRFLFRKRDDAGRLILWGHSPASPFRAPGEARVRGKPYLPAKSALRNVMSWA